VTTTAAGATYAAEAISVPDDIQHSPLWNKDLAPTPLSRRTWSTYNIAALWIGMSVVITTYTLASGLMQEGMTWWQALMTILLGNVIVLIPMVLNAHAGTKYGISFPVMCRASFGVRGARRRRVRVVRHSDVDRCAGAQYAVRCRVAELGFSDWGRGSGIRPVLADPGRDHRERNRGNQDAG